jgi:hypothetical protein
VTGLALELVLSHCDPAMHINMTPGQADLPDHKGSKLPVTLCLVSKLQVPRCS